MQHLLPPTGGSHLEIKHGVYSPVGVLYINLGGGELQHPYIIPIYNFVWPPMGATCPKIHPCWTPEKVLHYF